MSRYISTEWKFYHAFFRWATLCGPHMTRNVRVPKAQFPQSLRGLIPATRRHYAHLRQTGSHVDTQWLASQEVYNGTELPFESIETYGQAVRYKTAHHVVIEMAVPEKRVKGLQKEFGEGLQGLLNGYAGSSIDLGQTIMGMQKHKGLIRCVIITGPVQDVSYFRRVFRRKGRSNERVNNFSEITEHDGKKGSFHQMAVRDSVWEDIGAKAIKVYEQDDPDIKKPYTFSVGAPFVHRFHNGDEHRLRILVVGGRERAVVKVRDLFLAHDPYQKRANSDKETPKETLTSSLRMKTASDGAESQLEQPFIHQGGNSYVAYSGKLSGHQISVSTSSDAHSERSAAQALRNNPGDQAAPSAKSSSTNPVKSTDEASQQSMLSSSVTPRDIGKSPGPSQLAETLRLALRPLNSPVVVITTNSSRDPSNSHPRGVAVSSFAAVSLAPPMISFNLKLPSRSWSAMQATGEIAVHILQGSPQGAEVADAFTKPYDDPEEPFKTLQSRNLVKIDDARPHNIAPHLCKLERQFDVVTALIDAKVLPEKCVEVGDHIIVVAAVTAVTIPFVDTADTAQVEKFRELASALCYGRGAYRRAGKAMPTVRQEKPVSTIKADVPRTVAAFPTIKHLSKIRSSSLPSQVFREDQISTVQEEAADLEEEFMGDVAALEGENLSDSAGARDEAGDDEFFRFASQRPDEDEVADIARHSTNVPQSRHTADQALKNDHTSKDAAVDRAEDKIAADTAFSQNDESGRPVPEVANSEQQQHYPESLDGQNPAPTSSASPPKFSRRGQDTSGSGEWGTGEGVLRRERT